MSLHGEFEKLSQMPPNLSSEEYPQEGREQAWIAYKEGLIPLLKGAPNTIRKHGSRLQDESWYWPVPFPLDEGYLDTVRMSTDISAETTEAIGIHDPVITGLTNGYAHWYAVSFFLLEDDSVIVQNDRVGDQVHIVNPDDLFVPLSGNFGTVFSALQYFAKSGAAEAIIYKIDNDA